MSWIRYLKVWNGGRRNRQILAHCNTRELGFEIGGSFQPVAPKSQGFSVETMDHLDQIGLREKYAGIPGVDVSRIEAVDHVWNGRPYSEIVGGKNRYYWVVASHVIEHVPDMIGFLKDCTSVLRTGGVLALAVPDQRYTIDRDRPSTGLAQAIDAHLRKDSKPSVGALTELHLRAVKKWGRLSWRPCHFGREELANEPSTFRNAYCSYAGSTKYIDEHVWCHTPKSFTRLMNELVMIGELDLELLDVKPRWGLEFLAWLRKK